MVFPFAVLLKLKRTREINPLLRLACQGQPFNKVRAFHFRSPPIIFFTSGSEAMLFRYSMMSITSGS